MKRKKLIYKMALVAILIFVTAGAVNIYEVLYQNDIRENSLRKRDHRIAELKTEYQGYLNNIANNISTSVVDQNLISQINSYIFHKKPSTNLFLWMSDKEGKFVFGVPTADFTHLNKIFDKYHATIEKESYFVDRNDFLLRTLGRQDITRFVRPGSWSRFDELQEEAQIRMIENIYYPRYRVISDSIMLSSPIINEEGQVEGELYLKVDDSKVREILSDRDELFEEVLFPMFHVLLGISGVFLWLLIPSWVYIDARQRDDKRAFMWAILTVITFGFALAVYLVARPAAVKSFLCPQCEKELNGTKAFCPYCGFDLSSTFCPQCQYQVKADWQFCPNCRFDLTQKLEEGKEKEEKVKKEEEKGKKKKEEEKK